MFKHIEEEIYPQKIRGCGFCVVTDLLSGVTLKLLVYHVSSGNGHLLISLDWFVMNGNDVASSQYINWLRMRWMDGFRVHIYNIIYNLECIIYNILIYIIYYTCYIIYICFIFPYVHIIYYIFYNIYYIFYIIYFILYILYYILNIIYYIL